MNHHFLPEETISDNKIPDTVIGYVSVQAAESVFGEKVEQLHKTVKAYRAKKSDRNSFQRELNKMGFSILAESSLGYSVTTPGLVLGAKPDLSPAQVIETMTKTATDITTGSCHPRFNNPATLGADLATGAGLVNATAAVQYALDNF